MINITSCNLENLVKLSETPFSISYRDGDKVYKQYKKEIEYGDGWRSGNMELHKHPIKNYILSNKSSKLENTEIQNETLYIDNKFAGIVRNYIEGERLDKVLSTLNYEDRKSIAKKILKNITIQVLNGIYKRNLELKNVIVDDELNVTLIDLDGVNTSLSYSNNKRKIKRICNVLSDTIKEIFNDDKKFFRNTNEVKTNKYINYTYFFDSENTNNMTTIDEISKYIEEKDKGISIIFVYGKNEPCILKELSKNNKLILVNQNDNINRLTLYNLCMYYEKNGITFTDAVDGNKKEELLNSNKINKIMELKNNILIEKNIDFIKKKPKTFGK